jgi:hypothetical protein
LNSHALYSGLLLSVTINLLFEPPSSIIHLPIQNANKVVYFFGVMVSVQLNVLM